MAYASVGFYLTMEFIDSGSNVRTFTYPLTATVAADALTEGAAAVALWAAMSGAALLTWYVFNKMSDVALTPAAGSQVENQALLSYLIEDSLTRQSVVSIPAPVIGLFSSPTGPGSNIIDAGDAQILTFNALFLTGGTMAFKDGEQADAFIQGKRIHRRSNRG